MKIREIKFRAWFKDWDGVFRMSFSDRYEEDEIPTSAHTLMSYFFRNLSPDAILMQYTGLKDRNGKEIYEGDIVKYILPGETSSDATTEYTEPVSFIDGCFVVDGFTPVYVTTDWRVEVIGNIYENASMLVE